MNKIYYDNALKFFYGNGVRKDFGKAAWWFRRAADHGNSEAMYHLGEIFLLAEENPKHPDITWFTREDEVYRDVCRAFYWFSRCYEQSKYDFDGRIFGKIMCERLRFYGFGLDLKADEVFEYFLEAIKLPRREEIIYQVGKKYFKGKDDNPKDIDKAIHLFSCAAELGSNEAARVLGEIYRKGEVVARNINRAVFWYSKTRERHYLKALYKIGKMYRDGNGVEKDLEKACHYFEEVLQNLRWSEVYSGR